MIGLLIIKNNNDIINNMNANGEKMILDKKLYDNYVKILENELVPALGCTEPIAMRRQRPEKSWGNSRIMWKCGAAAILSRMSRV